MTDKHWYLQSGSVHIPGQFSSPSTGYHEHFIGIHLQKGDTHQCIGSHTQVVLTINNFIWRNNNNYVNVLVIVTEGRSGKRAGMWQEDDWQFVGEMLVGCHGVHNLTCKISRKKGLTQFCKGGILRTNQYKLKKQKNSRPTSVTLAK